MWYSARHTFGTELMELTGDPSLVMKQMGHEDFRTTSRYCIRTRSEPATQSIVETGYVALQKASRRERKFRRDPVYDTGDSRRTRLEPTIGLDR